jgi:Barstar (barnase inhibitor)
LRGQSPRSDDAASARAPARAISLTAATTSRRTMKELPTMVVECLRAPRPPWVAVLVADDPRALSRAIAALPNVAVRTIDGDRCSTRRELMSLFARTLRFPSYFAYSWAAFAQGVRDLEWMPPRSAHAIVIRGAERLLVEDAADYAMFLDVMNTVGEHLAVPSATRGDGIPLHVLLVTSSDGFTSRDWRVPQLKMAPAS